MSFATDTGAPAVHQAQSLSPFTAFVADAVDRSGPPIIQARGLSRSFKSKAETVQAVRGLDLDVRRGELVGFLGPNGAGKSTSLRMLTTLLAPTSGSATVCGFDVQQQPGEVRRRIGYIGQGNGAGHQFKVMDELVTQGRAYGLGGKESRQRGEELLVALGLEGLGGRVVNTLSGGQKRRLDVAMGLVHRPELLFLDEPSTGLDPQNRANLAEQIRKLRAEHGTTIFFTTHYLEEADQLAERVVVIDQGEVIADDTPEALKSNLAGDLITVSTPDAQRAAAVSARIGKAHETTVEPGVLKLRVTEGPALMPRLLAALGADGIEVTAAEIRRPTLDDVFLTLTGRSLRESNG